MEKETMRLDRFLVLAGAAKSRTDAKKFLRVSLVTVNGVKATDPEQKINLPDDSVNVNGKVITYQKNRYFVLNKPAGVISATKDRISETVLSLIPEADPKEYFPVGRLDKDTEGLLIITNDGAFAHRLTSPRKEVTKTYFVRITGTVNQAEQRKLEGGIVLADFTSKPARYRFLSEEGDTSECLLTITEGRFHEVKRMFHAVGHEVLYLKRIQIGSFSLPESLAPGQYLEYSGEQLHEAIFTTDKNEL